MAVRLLACLPRIAALTLVALLSTATVTLAADRQSEARQAPRLARTAAPTTLVVPDVRNQPYVFAKSALDESGFAWRVKGPVHGYAANTVAAQLPAPGTEVVDNGRPAVVLRLARNPRYRERGRPDDVAPFRASPIRLAPAAG